MSHTFFDMLAHGAEDITSSRTLNWATYQQEAENRLAMLEGDWEHQLKFYIQQQTSIELFLSYSKLYAWNTLDNILADVIGRVNRVYNRPAQRAWIPDSATTVAQQLVDTEEDPEAEPLPDQTFAEVISDLPLDQDFQRCISFMMAAGFSMIRPWIDSDGAVHHEILTPESTELITAFDDAATIVGLKYTKSWPDDHTKPTGRVFLWDMEGLAIAREATGQAPDASDPEVRAQIKAEFAGVIELGPGQGRDRFISEQLGTDYPYRIDGEPILPWTVFRMDNLPQRPINPFLGKDMYDATLMAGSFLLLSEWIARHQSHKQFIISGPGVDDIGNAFLDPITPVFLPSAEGGEVSVDIVDLAGNPAALLELGDKLLEKMLTKRGWSLEEFKASAQRQSGEAQEIATLRKGEFLQTLQQVAKVAEPQYALSLIAVWNADSDGTTIPDQGRYQLDLAQPSAADPRMRIENHLQLRDAGMESPIDYLQEIEEMSRDEALEKAARIRADIALFTTFGTPAQAQAVATPEANAEPEIPLTAEPPDIVGTELEAEEESQTVDA